MHITRLALLVAPVALLLNACDSTAPNPSQQISLSATIRSASASRSGRAGDVTVSSSNGSVRITSAQLVLSHVKLASDTGCSATTSDDDHDAVDSTDHEADDTADVQDMENDDEHDCEGLKVGPVLVDVPLDGTTKVILDALVPAGTYTGVRAKLDAVEGDDDGANQFLADHPGFQGVSVKVAGVFTDTTGVDHPFTFTSGVEAEIEMDFPSPVTVGAGTNNLTIDVNLASWFTDASGAVIDPTNPANQTAIERSIRASLRAFEDDNRDGNDDHEEDGGH